MSSTLRLPSLSQHDSPELSICSVAPVYAQLEAGRQKVSMILQPCYTAESGQGPVQGPCFPVHLGDLNRRGCLEPVRKEDAINNNKKQMAPSTKTPEKLRNGLFVHEDGAQMPWIVRKARGEKTCSWSPVSRLICRLTSWNSEQRLVEPAPLNSPQ